MTRTVIRMDWASAPVQVRLPPRTLRFPTGRSNGLFGTPVSGIDKRVAEEHEQLVEMIPQSFAGGVRFHRRDQAAHGRCEPTGQHVPSVGSQFVLPEVIAGCQHHPEHVQHCAREPRRSGNGDLQQFVSAAHAVVNQRARVVLAEQQFFRQALRVGSIA